MKLGEEIPKAFPRILEDGYVSAQGYPTELPPYLAHYAFEEVEDAGYTPTCPHGCDGVMRYTDGMLVCPECGCGLRVPQDASHFEIVEQS